MQQTLLRTHALRKLAIWLVALFFSVFLEAKAQTGYVVNGNAYFNGNNTWTLTPNAGNQSGSVWYQNFISLNANFDFTFRVFLGYNDGGADGIAFVLQPNSTGAGSSGGGLGYAGITPSLAVEYDTWQNDDPWYDHIALQPNGNVNTNYGALAYASARPDQGNIEDGQWHTTRIVWNATTKNFLAYFDGALRINYTGNIVQNLFGGNPNVYWGFTSATGGAANLQQFGIESTAFTEAPTVTISAANVTCFGGNDGSATANFSGGAAPYTFLGWNNGATSATISNLAAGTYTASMRDANGTVATKSVTITQPAAALAISASGAMSCTNPTVGAIQANAAGGTPGYTYSIDNGNTFQASAAFANLPAGSYPVVVKDSKGCTASTTVVLTQTAPLQLTAVAQNATGAGQCNGSVTLTPSGGTGPYVFNEFANDFAGNNLNTTDFNFVNGSFSQSGYLRANSAYNYGWNNSVSTQKVFTRTAGKSFEGKIYLENHTKYNAVMIGWARPDVLSDYTHLAHALYFHSSSYGGTIYVYESGMYRAQLMNFYGNTWYDFKIELTATGAAYYIKPATVAAYGAPLLVSTNSPIYSNLRLGTAFYGDGYYDTRFLTDDWKVGGNPPTANLCAGTYTYSVTDANGCTATATVNIQDYVPPVASFTTTDASCFGASDGSITVTASQGKAPYSYSIDNGNSFQAQNSFTGLPAGTYQVVAKDDTGTLTQAQTAEVGQPQQVVVTVAASGPLTFCPEGSVTLTATGAESYTWSNGATGASITVNQSGEYWVTGTTKGCASAAVSTTITVEDTQAPVPVVADLPSITAECAAKITAPTATDNCAGTVTATTTDPTFYTAQGTFTITWTYDDGHGNRTTQTQTVVIKDVTAPTLAQPAAVKVGNDAGKCGAAVILAVPATADNCGVASVGNNAPAGGYFPVGTTTVTWTVTDVNGLTTTATQNVMVTDTEKPKVVTRNITVQLNAIGKVVISAGDINNGSEDNCAVASVSLDKTAFSCSDTGANTVILTVTDASGNVNTATAVVTVKDQVAPVALAKDISVSLVNGLATIAASDIDAGSSDACGIAAMTLSKTGFTCDEIGDHTVTLTVTDVNGNVSAATAVVRVLGVKPLPTIAVSRTDNTNTGAGTGKTIFLGYGAQSLTLTAANATSAAAATAYSWSPATGLSSASVANPVFSPTAAGIYTYTVTATNEFGCSASTSVTLTVVDARCENGNSGKSDKVVMCHKGQNICIAPSAVQAHLAHGCTLGRCAAAAAPNARMGTNVEVADQIGLTVYPNPAVNTTTIEFTLVEEGSYQVAVYDMRGALVKVVARGRGEANKFCSYELDAAAYPAGVYLVKLATDQQVLTKRVVVQK